MMDINTLPAENAIPTPKSSKVNYNETKKRKTFTTKYVVPEIINILAKHEIPINAIDIVFDKLKETVSSQTILPISYKSKERINHE